MSRPSVSLPIPNAVTNTSYNQANQMLSFASTGPHRALHPPEFWGPFPPGSPGVPPSGPES